jgi:hypothetical protein
MLLAQYGCNDLYLSGGKYWTTDSVAGNAYPLKEYGTTPTLQAGKFGLALQTATVGYMARKPADGTQIPLAGKTAFTFAGWFYVGSTVGMPTSCLFSITGTSAANQVGVYIATDSTLALGGYMEISGSSYKEYSIANALTQNAWNHVVLRWSGTVLQIYVDLVQKFSKGLGNGSQTTIYMDAVNVGCLLYGWGTEYYMWPWKFDEIYFYDHSISDEEMAALTSANVSTSLMNHWRLDEYSGTNAKDTSTNANDGTLTGMSGNEWAFGVINRGLRFNASSKYINVPYSSVWNNSDDLTVSLWAKFYTFPTNLYNANSLVGRWDDSVSTSVVWGLGIVDRYVRFDCSYDGNWQGESLTTTQQLQTGQWYHIVVVHDSVNKTNTIYVDNANKISRGLANGGLYDHGSKTVEIGSMIFGGYRNYADAIIDDVRLFNRVLTVGDINALYELKSYKSFQHLTVMLSNCTYNGNVFDNNVEALEALVQTEFVKISNLEMRGVGCSMVRGATDSLTIGIAAGFYTASVKAKLDSTEALNLRTAINSAITALPLSGLVVSEVRAETTLIQDLI